MILGLERVWTCLIPRVVPTPKWETRFLAATCVLFVGVEVMYLLSQHYAFALIFGMYSFMWWAQAAARAKAQEDADSFIRCIALVNTLGWHARGLPLGTQLLFEGICDNCGQPVNMTTEGMFGVQCRHGHIVHYECLTNTNDRLRCPVCITERSKKEVVVDSDTDWY